MGGLVCLPLDSAWELAIYIPEAKQTSIRVQLVLQIEKYESYIEALLIWITRPMF
jgi:hypothetical protein